MEIIPLKIFPLLGVNSLLERWNCNSYYIQIRHKIKSGILALSFQARVILCSLLCILVGRRFFMGLYMYKARWACCSERDSNKSLMSKPAEKLELLRPSQEGFAWLFLVKFCWLWRRLGIQGRSSVFFGLVDLGFLWLYLEFHALEEAFLVCYLARLMNGFPA